MRVAAASSASPPNAIAPSEMRETLTPVRPSNFTDDPRSTGERAFDPSEGLLLGARHFAEAEDAAGRRRDHLREADDLILEEAVLFVVELRRECLDIGLPSV